MRKSLALVLCFLLVCSMIIPVSLGLDVKTTSSVSDIDKTLDDLYYLCRTPDGFNEERYEFYKEQLMKQYSENELIEDGETVTKDGFTPITSYTNLQSLGPMNSAWPMKCHDNHRSSQSLYNTADNPMIEKWRYYEDHWLENTPVIDNEGIIYIGDQWGDLDAIYPDGSLKWKYTLGGMIIGSSPAIDEEGTIYIGDWDSKLYAINSDGTLKWKFHADDANIGSSPAIGEDGTIYFGTMKGFDKGDIVAVNPNGTLKWSYTTNFGITSGPAIGDDGTIYIGSGDTYFYAMNPDGTLKWRYKTGDFIKGPPSIADDGTIYIGSFDDYLYALKPDGTLKWKCKIGTGTETNPAIASDGTIYVGSPDGHLYAVNPNGTLKWSFSVIGSIHQSCPTISADGTIYFGTDSGCYIYAVNPDGTEKWKKKIAKKWVQSSPSIAEDGTVYIGSTYNMATGYLYAFGTAESTLPPEAPSISGEQNGKIGEDYWYYIGADDPDNNPVSIYIDWGDGTYSNWSRLFASGEIYAWKHRWSEPGTYTIRAKAKDSFDEESNWAEYEVRMIKSRSKTVLDFVWVKFLDMFPILQRLLELWR